MSKIDKLLKRFLSNPKDFTWDELKSILSHFGYAEYTGGKTAGSRRKFINGQNSVIIAHKPHPQNVVKTYLINQIIEKLEQENLL